MIQQQTPEWLAARLGKVTASRISDLLARTKSGWGASRANYMGELIAERLTGAPAERFTSPAMQWGTEKEADARAAYEFRRDVEVRPGGFFVHPRITDSGASPDGLIGDDGLLELKCPNTSTHIETLLTGVVPSKYACQMQWQMACSGRAWCDFGSFDPRLPETMSLFVQRVPRDDRFIAETEGHVIEFLADLDKKIAALGERYQIRRAA